MQKVDNEMLYKMAEFYVKNRTTIHETAKNFGIGKSTVHRLFMDYLTVIDSLIAEEVLKIIEFNKSVCALRGGLKTKEKFMSEGQKC